MYQGLVAAAEPLGLDALPDVIGRAPGVLDTQRGVGFGNIELLNTVLMEVHPELK